MQIEVWGFIQWLQNRQTVTAFTFDDPWFDIGTPESYLDAIDWHLDGETYVHPEAEVENTTLGDSVQVLPGASLVDATVDRSVIFPDATVRDAELRETVIDKQTHVESLDLAGAVIGAHTRLNGD